MIRYDEVIGLGISDIYDLYRSNSNTKLPDIYKKFSFGQEIIDKAEGAFLTSRNGKVVLDLTGGLGVANFGHNNKRILDVREKYSKSLRPEIHKSYLNPFLAAASKNVADVLGAGLNYSFFCNSGAEAVDGALKISYKRHNGTRKFALHSDRSFHGKTIGAGSLSAGDNFVGGKGRFFFQKIPNVSAFEFSNYESIVNQCEAVGPKNVYAIFVEPFSCSTLTESSKVFLEKTRRYCDKHEITLVFDEIYSGFAKCGYDFYFQKYGVSPDIICLSKALGGGKASISAYVTKQEVYEKAYGSIAGALTHSTTYNSFGEECATVLEACNILVDEDVSGNAKLIEGYLSKFLGQLKHDFPKIISEVRGAGTHFGIVIKSPFDLFLPVVNVLPIDFTSDPLFLPKLYATAIANDLWNEGCMLLAFTSNQEMILNISPAPVTDLQILKDYLPRVNKTLKKDPHSLVMGIIKNGMAKL